MGPADVLDEDAIEHDDILYFKLGGKWYIRCKMFFASDIPKDESKIPEEVKKRWAVRESTRDHEEQEEHEPPLPSPSPLQLLKGSLSPPLPQKRNSPVLGGTVEGKSTVKPEQRPLPKQGPIEVSHLRPKSSWKAKASPFANTRRSGDFTPSPMESTSVSVSTKKECASPIVVTDSFQKIRTLKAKLKAENLSVAIELTSRLAARKSLFFDENEDERLHPFELPKKMNKRILDFIEQRNDERGKLTAKAADFVSMLRKNSKQQSKRKRAAIQAKVKNAAVSKTSKKGLTFKIDDLPNFADKHEVTVLNLDRFICATDMRKIVYDGEGRCIFCKTHGDNSVKKHARDEDCPYYLCACANCYLVGRLETTI